MKKGLKFTIVLTQREIFFDVKQLKYSAKNYPKVNDKMSGSILYVKMMVSVPSKSSTKMKVHFILPVTIRKRFSILHTIEDIHFGLVRMYVTPSYLLDNIYI